MSKAPTQRIDRHNRAQQRYFAETFKRTMQPASTPYLNR